MVVFICEEKSEIQVIRKLVGKTEFFVIYGLQGKYSTGIKLWEEQMVKRFTFSVEIVVCLEGFRPNVRLGIAFIRVLRKDSSLWHSHCIGGLSKILRPKLHGGQP